MFRNDDEDKIEWDALVKDCGLKNVASKIMLTDVLLHGRTAKKILAYSRTVLDVLKHHRDTL